MAILYDARGNELRTNFPDSVTNETVTDARPITSVLGSLNAEVTMDLNGAATATFDIRTSAAVLTLVFEGTVDNVNYFALPAFAQQQLLAAAIVQESYVSFLAIATTQSGLYTVGVTGLRRVRVRVSAYTSGNVTVAARGSRADLIIYSKDLPSNLNITATAAINTAATATLPAQSGLFHYITNIELVKLYGVIGIAAGAGVIVTSTNLPGNPAWTTEQLALAAGSAVGVIRFTPANPLKSLAASTATTFVAPVQLQTIWRWNVSYYVGA